jgi:hypothetical protein
MSMRLFGTMFIIACVILAPINKHFSWLPTPGDPNDPTQNDPPQYIASSKSFEGHLPDNSYLWAYLVFTYLFTGLIIYFIRTQTLRIIRVRQDYLGSQSTITDRTLKLSGIPSDLRSEESIKELIEKLEIGQVESVTICRNWKRLDDLMTKRTRTLRKLEEAWAVHIGPQHAKVRIFGIAFMRLANYETSPPLG